MSINVRRPLDFEEAQDRNKLANDNAKYGIGSLEDPANATLSDQAARTIEKQEQQAQEAQKRFEKQQRESQKFLTQT